MPGSTLPLAPPQVSAYPGPHGVTATTGTIYPGQASLLDHTDAWNHRSQEVSLWRPTVEVSVYPHQLLCPIPTRLAVDPELSLLARQEEEDRGFSLGLGLGAYSPQHTPLGTSLCLSHDTQMPSVLMAWFFLE